MQQLKVVSVVFLLTHPLFTQRIALAFYFNIKKKSLVSFTKYENYKLMFINLLKEVISIWKLTNLNNDYL